MACSIRHSLKLGLRCDLVPPGQTWPLPLCPLSAPLHSGKMFEGHGLKVDAEIPMIFLSPSKLLTLC